jgi:hypothetical protein
MGKLDDFFNDPEYADLLGDATKSESASPNTELDRLLEVYNVVKDFYQVHGRLPEESSDFTERRVFSKYNGLISDPSAVEALKEHDSLGILFTKEYASLEDAFDDPELSGLLRDGPLDMFTLKHVKKYEPPEYVARRRKCERFEDYEPLFIKCHEDLKSGRRRVLEYRGTTIDRGKFYVIRGMLCYIARVGELKRENDRNLDARLLVIFENGTESDLLLQSLRRSISLQKGWMVTVPDDESLDPSVVEDVKGGTVYVLRSLIDNEVVQSLEHFYKIGFTVDPIEERIRNAANEATYMYAAVKLVAEYEILNARAQGVEKLLHKFFAGANLDIEIDGHHPREWFQVPLDQIDLAVEMVISGQIIHYHYNVQNQCIEPKS